MNVYTANILQVPVTDPGLLYHRLLVFIFLGHVVIRLVRRVSKT